LYLPVFPASYSDFSANDGDFPGIAHYNAEGNWLDWNSKWNMVTAAALSDPRGNVRVVCSKRRIKYTLILLACLGEQICIERFRTV
jgi:hypothetical protein